MPAAAFYSDTAGHFLIGGVDSRRAEQAIRKAVVNRKVWGGNRSEAGATAQSILMTVLFMANRQRRDGMEIVSRVLRTPRLHPPPMLVGGG